MATGTASKGGEQGAGTARRSAGRGRGRQRGAAVGEGRPPGFRFPETAQPGEGAGAGPGAGSPCGPARVHRWGPRPAPTAPRRVLVHGDGNHCAAPPSARTARASERAALWPREGVSLPVGALRFHVEQEGRGWHFLFCPDGGHTPPTCLRKDCCGGGGAPSVVSSERAMGARHGSRCQRGRKRDATSQKAEWVLRGSPRSLLRPELSPCKVQSPGQDGG